LRPMIQAHCARRRIGSAAFRKASEDNRGFHFLLRFFRSVDHPISVALCRSLVEILKIALFLMPFCDPFSRLTSIQVLSPQSSIQDLHQNRVPSPTPLPSTQFHPRSPNVTQASAECHKMEPLKNGARSRNRTSHFQVVKERFAAQDAQIQRGIYAIYSLMSIRASVAKNQAANRRERRESNFIF
jgi:hypothetical protein